MIFHNVKFVAIFNPRPHYYRIKITCIVAYSYTRCKVAAVDLRIQSALQTARILEEIYGK